MPSSSIRASADKVATPFWLRGWVLLVSYSMLTRCQNWDFWDWLDFWDLVLVVWGFRLGLGAFNSPF